MISLSALAARVRPPWRALLLLGLFVAALARPAWATEGEGDITLRGQYWLDASGEASIAQVAGGAATLTPTPPKPDWPIMLHSLARLLRSALIGRPFRRALKHWLSPERWFASQVRM